MVVAACAKPRNRGTFLLWSAMSLTLRVSIQVTTRAASATPALSPHSILDIGVS